MIPRFLKKIYSVIILVYKKKFVHSLFVLFNGEKKRYDYQLSENSIVIDGGGYNGDFSKKIFNLYKCKIFIFEPYEFYYSKLKKIFKNNKKISVFSEALSNANKNVNLVKLGDETFISNSKKDNKSIVKAISIISFIKKNNLKKIDLLKLNVEGAEYSILEDILNSDLQGRFVNLQIQFHKSYENKNRYNQIKNKLEKKYKLIWRYPWIWESWKLKH